uniref:Uncharacterized protein n=1 Tax=Solanum tuberosum TaxID=4113 RepID=M1DN36_SOLTU
MNTRRTPRKRVEEEVVNEGVPNQGNQSLQVDQVPLGNQENEVSVVPVDMTNEEIREAKQAFLNGPNLDAPKKNRFYELQDKEDKGFNPDEGVLEEDPKSNPQDPLKPQGCPKLGGPRNGTKPRRSIYAPWMASVGHGPQV